MLDIKIKTFLKVVELKSYTKAAEELDLTQPAVSQQIRKLEVHYGCKLIDISGKGVEMTEQGKALNNYAHFQIANENQLIRQLKKIESPIRIGATLSIADYYLPDYVSGLLKKAEVSVSVTVKNTKNILNMLLENELDCAFIEGIFDKNLFSHKEFIKTKFLPIARIDHPLANRRIDIEAIHNYPLILREEGSGTREIYENYLYQLNDSIHSAQSIYEISSFGIIKKILSKTDAISFMYEAVAAQEVETGSLTVLDIKGFEIQRPLYFIFPHNSLMRKDIENFYQELMKNSK